MNFIIYGTPIPWKRPVGTKIRYDTQSKEKEQIRWQLSSNFNSKPISTPIRVDIILYFPIPKGTSTIRKKQMLNNEMYHIKRPDADNCAKFILDCMNDLIFEDDSQVVDLVVSKRFGVEPQTLIKVTQYDLKQTLIKDKVHAINI
jgi:Holliday junction resolvase RusA-like endonuclease